MPKAHGDAGDQVMDASAVVDLVPSTATYAFEYTGSPQTWVVPSGVVAVKVDVRGAQGGGNGAMVPGGKGARVETILAVTPGDTLIVYVGGRGGDGVLPNSAGGGGWNGGGPGGIDHVDHNAPAGGGGGATDIRLGGADLVNRVVVAGGGGGSECCSDGAGGNGNGTMGNSGTCSGWECQCAVPGSGGTTTAGGSGGLGCNGNGAPGSLGLGGVGGNGNRAGGGGGGGYYGGGGGGGCCLGAGGGGGSSYSSGTETAYVDGYQVGHGQALVSWIR